MSIEPEENSWKVFLILAIVQKNIRFTLNLIRFRPFVTIYSISICLSIKWSFLIPTLK